MHILQASLGLIVFIAAAWLVSTDRRAMPWRLVASALALQFAIALLLLRVEPARDALYSLNGFVEAIEAATLVGSAFVFGFLGGSEPSPYAITEASATYVFAFRVLPQILVFSVLVAVLWHWRILGLLVRGMAWALRKTLGVGGAEGLAATSNIFLGMVEAPLLIRAYLGRMSRAELFSVMTCGMSTVAGSVMILYANVLDGVIANPLGQLLTASVMAVPASILLSRVMHPATDAGLQADVAEGLAYASTMDAITRGTGDGLKLVVNIGAMLIVLVSLVALVNGLLALLPDVNGGPLSLQRMLGVLFAPMAWLMGVPWSECIDAGGLLGTKLVLNELVAFIDLARLGPDAFGERSEAVLTFALCGFANVGSLGIMLGGLSAMAPERRSDILELAPWSLYSGTLASMMTGAVVAIVY
jgi:CNT family concentrative nucleoside transporter